MFQTGYDEPLLLTMFVDKILKISRRADTARLNRAHPKKHDTFVLDFANHPQAIIDSFSQYYRTTILSGETDPNKLYDVIAVMEQYEVYSQDHIESLVDLYLNGAERDRLDRFWTPARRYTKNCLWKIRSSSKVQPSHSCVRMVSLVQYCLTAIRIGKSSPSS
jgi:type I site-specific restriction-modification system R (restriction) subunit